MQRLLGVRWRHLHGLLPLLWWLWASPACAWGELGHRLIADMAQSGLSEPAQRRLHGLLSLEGHGALADIASWADQHRNPATAPWHFVNFPRGTCLYQPERDCGKGDCVVAAIERQRLAWAQAKDAQTQLLALKYLVHLLADIHQPLHAGYQDDRGGNSVQLQAFMVGSNLHALWDTLIIRQLDAAPGWRVGLQARFRAWAAPGPWSAVTAAQESCQVVGSPGFYPDRRVGLDYMEQFTPALEQRLLLAAQRTAQVLNQLLSEDLSPVR